MPLIPTREIGAEYQPVFADDGFEQTKRSFVVNVPVGCEVKSGAWSLILRAMIRFRG